MGNRASLACLLWLWLPEVRVFVDFLHLVGVDILSERLSPISFERVFL
jgi:hypothetical protein